jgi:hypothetical protein
MSKNQVDLPQPHAMTIHKKSSLSFMINERNSNGNISGHKFTLELRLNSTIEEVLYSVCGQLKHYRGLNALDAWSKELSTWIQKSREVDGDSVASNDYLEALENNLAFPKRLRAKVTLMWTTGTTERYTANIDTLFGVVTTDTPMPKSSRANGRFLSIVVSVLVLGEWVEYPLRNLGGDLEMFEPDVKALQDLLLEVIAKLKVLLP